MPNIPNWSFNDGHTMPQLGFGIWQVAQDEAAQAVSSAISTGYRLIDGAHIYGNEKGMGEGVRQSGVPREELFLTSKVWNGEHGKAKTRIAVERSLKVIGVEQMDLMLIHWPVPSQDLYLETWKTLIELRDEGLIRSIGVSNFNRDHLERIIGETGEVPVLNQIEHNPRLQQPELHKYHDGKGILVQSWTPLGQGISFDSEPITNVCKRTGKSPAQVILRWNIQLGKAVIARSVNPDRQAQNLDIFDFELTQDEIKAISTLDVGWRTGPDPSVFKLGT